MVKKVTTKKTGLKVFLLKRIGNTGYDEWSERLMVAIDEKAARILSCELIYQEELKYQKRWAKGDWVIESRDKILERDRWDDPEFATCELISNSTERVEPGLVVGHFCYAG